MTMPKPAREKVIAKAREVFPEADPTAVLAALDRYGTESYEQERERVQLAILKLCHEEGLTSPDRYVESAKRDYRDVLAWAEYPGQMDPSWFSLDKDEQDRIRRADSEQYLTWLDD